MHRILAEKGPANPTLTVGVNEYDTSAMIKFALGACRSAGIEYNDLVL